MNLKEQLAAALAKANVLIEKHRSGATLTDGEVQQLQTLATECRDLKSRIDQAAKASALLAGFGTADDAAGGQAATAGHLAFAGLADSIVSGMKAYSGQVRPGTKALVPAGETILPVPLVNPGDPLPGDVSLESPPRLVDVLPAVVRSAPAYRVLRQVTVTDPGGAGVVAPGAVKPTMKLGLSPEDARLRVIAVLSEPTDKFLLEDAANLQTWVRAELVEGIQTALEQEVLAGDGTGEHFLGLANTSGLQTQAYSTDRITTIAAGLAKVTNLGVGAQFIALSPADVLALQTTRNASGAFDLGGAIDAAKGTAWGVRYVPVPGLPAGTGYVVGSGALVVSTDGKGIRAEWGTPGDTFTKNQLVARVEGRFNLDVLAAHRVVKLALTGA